jgi:hypothetical protein
MDETYVLIKKYPGSPELGRIVCGNHGWVDANGTITSSLSDFPEFWQLQERVEFTRQDMIKFSMYCQNTRKLGDSTKDLLNEWISLKNQF